MKEIKSTQNKKIKEWSKLTQKSERRRTGCYLIESWHLVGTAIQTKQPIKWILTTPEQLNQHRDVLNRFENLILITDRVAKRLGSTVHPQGIFAIVQMPDSSSIDPKQVKDGRWLLLDQVQDPGNIGTMVRTADAAGFSGVIFGLGTASPYNPKVVRAMQGSQFHLKLANGNLKDWITNLTTNHVPVYGTILDPEAIDYRKVKPSDRFGLVMGNEGNGMQKQLLKLTTKNLYIPIKGQAESLNVAVAAGILMFELIK
ncbi:TrmH family RNA methyltransferase [Acetilactobacillus jinshanensis]|uniref:RNA methyltransferase n=1 Tax=Acetilactobacillus jinshanensis TaxID=1720083 RepID=A0A4V1ALS9_9LACO|nr:RNA methyltransferase [Acetilactobacillus jinshanensis]QBP18659.1 RNA methyltransferase [Acetilactobacillus jinshanensis]URL61535.1 RNA methyltransferase [uncultured bacterium]